MIIRHVTINSVKNIFEPLKEMIKDIIDNLGKLSFPPIIEILMGSDQATLCYYMYKWLLDARGRITQSIPFLQPI